MFRSLFVGPFVKRNVGLVSAWRRNTLKVLGASEQNFCEGSFPVTHHAWWLCWWTCVCLVAVVLCCCERRVSWDSFVAEVVYLGCRSIPLCSIDSALFFHMHCAALMALVCSKEHTLLDGIIAWGQLVILCQGAAPQRIHTSFKKATSKGLSVQGYAPISSPVASLLGKGFCSFCCGKKTTQNFWRISDIPLQWGRYKENILLKWERQPLSE